MDNGEPAPKTFAAPQPQLFALIIDGILGGSLPWGLVITGVLIAVVLELLGVSSLPFAVGMYLPLSFLDARSSSAARSAGWPTDWRGKPASEAEAETSPGVLLVERLHRRRHAHRTGDRVPGVHARDARRARPDPVPRRRVQRAGFRLTRRSSPLATFAAIAAILFRIASRKEAKTEPRKEVGCQRRLVRRRGRCICGNSERAPAIRACSASPGV